MNPTTNNRQTKKYSDYRASQRREKHKVMHILRSSGYIEAMAYANRHGLTVWAQTAIRRTNKASAEKLA